METVDRVGFGACLALIVVGSAWLFWNGCVDVISGGVSPFLPIIVAGGMWLTLCLVCVGAWVWLNRELVRKANE